MNFKTKILSVLFYFGAYLKFILCFAVLCVFAVNFYSVFDLKHCDYEIGDVVLRDVKTPVDFLVEDRLNTEISRCEAMSEVLNVYDLDSSVVNSITDRVDNVFNQFRNLYSKIDQVYFSKSCLEFFGSECDLKLYEAGKKIFLNREYFSEALGISVSDGAYKVLVEYQFTKEVSDFINSIIIQVLFNGVISDKETLLLESKNGITLRDLERQKEISILNLRALYGLDQARSMVRMIAGSMFNDLNYDLFNLVVDFSQRLIRPNISSNIEETRRRQDFASTLIEPFFYNVKSGEVVLRKGDLVTSSHLVKLRAMEDKCEVSSLFVLGAVLILGFILVICYLVSSGFEFMKKKLTNKDLLFLSLTLSIMIISIKILEIFPDFAEFWLLEVEPSFFSVRFGIPLVIGSMLVCLILGFGIAFQFAFISASIAVMLLNSSFGSFLYFFLSSIMASWLVMDCRERSAIILSGAKLAIFSVIMVVSIYFYEFESYLYSVLFFDVLIVFLGSIISGVVVIGLLPVVEMLFNYMTNIVLLELSNLDKPLLRRLMLEAPGTYHHSVVVGSMVEAAAVEIGANPLLSKICGYYHDLGKLKQPSYFVENQIDCKNKHDKLSPSMSSLVLIAHVRHGVDIARKYKLNNVIIDVIRQHHGTSSISYFFEKAKRVKGSENVRVDDFRYHGPIPQTVEAGLVMLADVVEAASRTLSNPTPSKIRGLVQDLINRVFSDGQLDDCELTLKDLNYIAKSFNKVLGGIYHHRIEYRNYSKYRNGKSGNGCVCKEQAEFLSDVFKKDSKNSPIYFRRIGLS